VRRCAAAAGQGRYGCARCVGPPSGGLSRLRAQGSPAAHRVDPALALTGVPTLLAWRPGGGASARLGPELEACGSGAEVEALLRRTGFFGAA
jgi:hypothetical protein